MPTHGSGRRQLHHLIDFHFIGCRELHIAGAVPLRRPDSGA